MRILPFSPEAAAPHGRKGHKDPATPRASYPAVGLYQAHAVLTERWQQSIDLDGEHEPQHH